jgi:dihydroxyacetone kinase-like protein
VSAPITRSAVVAWLRAYAREIGTQRDYLTELDAAIGDADHGVNMERGMQAVAGRLEGETANTGMGPLFKLVGMTLVSTVGGAAGPLYGTLFLQLGSAMGDRTELELVDWLAALEAGVGGVQARGKAEPGDKTMVDALLPAVAALRQSVAGGRPTAAALHAAAEAAREGMLATVPMVARKGRASYLGERSAGHQDPGATSSWLLMQTAADCLAGDDSGGEADSNAGEAAAEP